MLPRADISNVHPVGRTDPVRVLDEVGSARQEAFQRSMSGLVGKSMLASVLSRLADGSSLVNLQGSPVRMMLPAGVQVGADVPLTLVAASPRPTFQLTGGDGQPIHASAYQPATLPAAARSSQAAVAIAQLSVPTGDQAAGAGGTELRSAQPGAAALGQATTLGQQAAQKTVPPLPELNGAVPAPVLSDAGRVISSVLSAAQHAPAGPNAIEGTEALIKAAHPDPAQLATKLQDTISRSGLFYESHVAEWAQGARSLNALMQEPQTQRPPGAVPTDPATAQFINLQLTSQENSRVLWQGQLMPGQQMQWELHKDAPQGRGDAEQDGQEGQPVWRSGMRFRLPLLGDIDATVVMVGGQCQVEIKAGSTGIGALLRSHASALTAAMEAAGTPLTALSIGVAREEGSDG